MQETNDYLSVSVGLYAKWGSGKSFLLGKLRDEMKAFTQDWQIEPIFENTPLVFMVILHFALFFGVTAWILSYLTIGLGTSSTIVAVITGSVVVLLSYALFMSLWKFNQINFVTFQDLKVSSVFCSKPFFLLFSCVSTLSFPFFQNFLANQFNNLKLIIQVIFSHPPGPDNIASSDQGNVYPLRLLFTDTTRVITSAGGQNSVTQMIGSLYDAIEDHYGTVASRLFRAFR